MTQDNMTPKQRRKYAPLFFMFMLSIALLINLSGHLGKRKPIILGKPIQHFDIPLLERPFSEFTPKTWAGKPVIINIFASWCEPCKIEHEHLMTLAKATKVPIYGIAWKDKEKEIQKYLTKYGNPYSLIAYDSQGSVTIPFSMTGIPETYVIDASGLVVFHQASSLDATVIKDKIIPLLKTLEKPNAAAP